MPSSACRRGRRARLHPAGHADHRRPAPAGRAREHLGLHLLRLGHRHHRPEGGRGRAAWRPRWRGSSGTPACRWRWASASASPSRRPRSRASPMPRGRLGPGRPARRAPRRRRAGPRPELVPAVHAKVRGLADGGPGCPGDELAHRLCPAEDPRALHARASRSAGESLAPVRVLRADDLPPRPGGQPARLPALRPPHAGRPRLPLRGAVRRGQLAAAGDAARPGRPAALPRPEEVRRPPARRRRPRPRPSDALEAALGPDRRPAGRDRGDELRVHGRLDGHQPRRGLRRRGPPRRRATTRPSSWSPPRAARGCRRVRCR